MLADMLVDTHLASDRLLWPRESATRGFRLALLSPGVTVRLSGPATRLPSVTVCGRTRLPLSLQLLYIKCIGISIVRVIGSQSFCVVAGSYQKNAEMCALRTCPEALTTLTLWAKASTWS